MGWDTGGLAAEGGARQGHGDVELHDELPPHHGGLLYCAGIAISASERGPTASVSWYSSSVHFLVLASVICFSVWIHIVFVRVAELV